ncbi:DUF1800 domain-containing protein [Sphingomonas sp. RIT328]|uniref:DUF1800 domain-containing protein n=2 Tax=Sphingomonas kyungheensis TaxID=1069987 RepID=A0ABU8H7B9_9SPHN|nr:DUF1800 domain-containing protein [Sphingomonas sp. RIT328]EZP50779.1 hypothetical protein BW41_03119 [Sphingomonas sp. RIT328]
MRHHGIGATRLAAVALALLPAPALAAGEAPGAGIGWANRLTWGVTAADARAANPDRWLDAQLASDDTSLPAPLAATVAQMRISREPLAQIVVAVDAQNRAAKALTDPAQREAARKAYQATLNAVADEARQRSVLRDLYAPDQLREQMTWFWFNHFNVQANKRDIRLMVGDYEQTLHAQAFGRFRDILEATLRHPAMLRYLDNDQNAVGRINENYAREIMELHSLGVGSGYSQQDVQELARILTGVGVSLRPEPPRLRPQWQPLYLRAGLFEFNPARHDFGDKHFLGHVIKGSGFGEVEQALDLIAAAPATAQHVATELATYFMGDAPPPALVARMAARFQRSHGDMAEVMRTMIRSREFAASTGRAFKDPAHYAISAVRLAYGDRVILNPMPIVGWLNRMGEGLYNHETPDGYPLDRAAWSGPGQMATRFDIARQIGGGSAGLFRRPGVADEAPAFPQVQNALYYDGLAATLGPPTRDALAQARSPQEWNALFLSSPEFMRR